MRGFEGFLGAMFLAAAAHAHPHAETDRQAALTLSSEGAVITLIVVPGTRDGPGVAQDLDADRDGAVSDAEAVGLAQLWFAEAVLTVDGRRTHLELLSARADDLDRLASGTGAVFATASAEVAMGAVGTVSLTMGRAEPAWFVQVYYAENFTEAVAPPVFERTPDGVVLTFGGD